MPKKSTISSSSRKKGAQQSLISRVLSSRKATTLVVFVLAFSIIGGVFLWRSYAATGDELQAKDNAKWGTAIAKRITVAPDGSYGFTLDGYGALHPFHTFGAQPTKPSGLPYFPNMDIARDVVFTHWSPTAAAGYILDGYGGVHPFGGAQAVRGAPYWNGWDVARRIVLTKVADGTGGYVLDANGGLHPFAVGSASMPPKVNQGPYWPGLDVARDVIIRSDNAVGLILDCHGGVTPVGLGSNAAPAYPNGYPYDKNRCDYQSFVINEWTKPSGVVINGQGQFAGYGTWSVPPFYASGLGKVVDGMCRNNVGAVGTRRCWLMDDHGNIRAFSDPNVPIFTAQEQAFFAAAKAAADKAAADAAAAKANAAKPKTSSSGSSSTGSTTKPGFNVPPANADFCAVLHTEWANEMAYFEGITNVYNLASYYSRKTSSVVDGQKRRAQIFIDGFKANDVNGCADKLNDPNFKGYAYGAISDARGALGDYNKAVQVWINP